MKSKGLNFLEKINEYGICFLSGTLFLYTDYVPSPKLRFKLGWFYVFFFTLFMLVNSIDLFVRSFIKLVIKPCKICLLKRKRVKNAKLAAIKLANAETSRRLE